MLAYLTKLLRWCWLRYRPSVDVMLSPRNLAERAATCGYAISSGPTIADLDYGVDHIARPASMSREDARTYLKALHDQGYIPPLGSFIAGRSLTTGQQNELLGQQAGHRVPMDYILGRHQRGPLSSDDSATFRGHCQNCDLFFYIRAKTMGLSPHMACPKCGILTDIQQLTIGPPHES